MLQPPHYRLPLLRNGCVIKNLVKSTRGSGALAAHERTSQASTGSREQAHTEPCWRAANVEVRWKKWCVSKNEQSCRQSNRLCKSSPYFLCDYGEKEAKKQNAVPAGGLSQVQPRATAQSPPGRAAHSPYGARALSALSPQIVSSGRCKKMCVRTLDSPGFT